MKTKRTLFYLFIFIFFCGITVPALAQKIDVSGKVVSEEGEELPGVSIAVKGTTTGTVTDIEGNYSLKANPDDVLVFSYIGYETMEIPVRSRNSIDVNLFPDIETLSEVVVIGYGQQKKKDLTGAVASITGDDVGKIPTIQVSDALQGQISGVNVSSGSGAPGSGNNITIRGLSTINNNNVLVVVDGNQGASLNDLNPDDIKSIDVLKDASAAAIYGARGANGVIMVTTKRGKKGEPKISFNGFSGVTMIPRSIEFLNSEQYINLMNEVWEPEGGVLFDTDYQYADNDWLDLLTQTGVVQNYSLSVSNATENTNYYLSAGYVNEKGTIKLTDFQRFNVRLNSEFTIKDRVTLGEQINISTSNGNDAAGGVGLRSVAEIAPIMDVLDPRTLGGNKGFASSRETVFTPEGSFLNTGRNDRTNWVGPQHLIENTDQNYRIFPTFYADVKIIEGLNFRSQINGRFAITEDEYYEPIYDLNQRSNAQAEYRFNRNKSLYWQWTQQLTYAKTFGKHNLNLTAVYEAQRNEFYSFSTRGIDARDEIIRQIDNFNGVTTQQDFFDNAFLSLLGRVLYNYDGKYFANFSLREDGSSRFGFANRFGVFPAASVGWTASEEAFMDPFDIVSLLKVRASWGLTGNTASLTSDYPSYAQLLDPLRIQYDLRGENSFNDPGVDGDAVFNSLGNPNIRWEAVEQINIGLDLNLFDDKIQIIAEYFEKNLDDMILPIPIPEITGLRASETGLFGNVGNVRNRGFEYNISYKHYFNSDFQVRFSTNGTMISNLITDFGGGAPVFDGVNRQFPGHPVNAFFGNVVDYSSKNGIFQTEEEIENAPLQRINGQVPQPGDVRYKDINGDGRVDLSDRAYIGSPIPDFIGGFNVQGDYKNFDFTMFLTATIGIDALNLYNRRILNPSSGDASTLSININKRVEALNYWTPDNTETTVPRLNFNDLNNAIVSDFWVEDASFLRLRTLAIGYSIPDFVLDNIGFDRIRIYATSKNLFTVTGYTGYDPELGGSMIDSNPYPNTRQIMGGVQLTF